MKKKLIYIIVMSIIFGILYTTSIFAANDSESFERIINEYYNGNPNGYSANYIETTIKPGLLNAYKAEWADYSKSTLDDIINENNLRAQNARGSTQVIASTKISAANALKSEKSESTGINYWDPHGNSNEDAGIKDFADTIVSVIRNIGIIISVIALMIIGLRQMTGSVEEKSILKQALPGYLLGVFMVIAITTIPSLIYNIVKNL